MRNPYDLEVSRYYHLRKSEAYEPDNEKSLALKLSFDEFVIKSQFRAPHPQNPELEFREAIKNYYSMGTVFPKNLRILRYECVQEDLDKELGALGYGPVPLQSVNVSEERPDRSYKHLIKTKDVESAIYTKYRWLFEHGYYTRLSV
jgi:hypothetical protein